MMLFNQNHLMVLVQEIYEDLDGYIQIDLNDAKGTQYLEIIVPTTQEENPAIHDVTATDFVNVTNPSYSLMSGGVILEDNPFYNEIIVTQSH